jgi:hypothetical protein
MHEHKGCKKKIKYVHSGHDCAQSSSIVFHSILFNSKHILETLKKAMVSKFVFLTSCKHGQKF